MPSPKEKILRSAYQEYAGTNSRQHNTQSSLNNKAVEVLKVNLLVGGVAATIITISPDNIAIPYFLVGTLTLLTSIWYCTRVYSQTYSYDIGIDEDEIYTMISMKDPEKHYEELAKAYSNMVGDFDEIYEEESKAFETGLWAATATIFLLIAGAGSTLLTTILENQYPLVLDIPIMLIIGLLIMYGKYREYCLTGTFNGNEQ